MFNPLAGAGSGEDRQGFCLPAPAEDQVAIVIAGEVNRRVGHVPGINHSIHI